MRETRPMTRARHHLRRSHRETEWFLFGLGVLACPPAERRGPTSTPATTAPSPGRLRSIGSLTKALSSAVG